MQFSSEQKPRRHLYRPQLGWQLGMYIYNNGYVINVWECLSLQLHEYWKLYSSKLYRCKPSVNLSIPRNNIIHYKIVLKCHVMAIYYVLWPSLQNRIFVKQWILALIYTWLHAWWHFSDLQIHLQAKFMYCVLVAALSFSLVSLLSSI